MKPSAKVLLVDDNPAAIEPLDRRLRAMGFSTRLAHDGQRALELARAERPDVAVLDVMMPEVNGYQVCREIKRIDDTIRVAIVTAKADAADRFWATECGADAFMTKPVDPEAVVRWVVSQLPPP